ncbi:MAG: hypothetical protein ABIP53_04180 [Candidatus Limnocylindrales bacterium]
MYSFTGATPDDLLRFADKHPGARTIAPADRHPSTARLFGRPRVTANSRRKVNAASLPVGVNAMFHGTSTPAIRSKRGSSSRPKSRQ